MQPDRVNGPGTGILIGACVNSRSRPIFGDGPQSARCPELADSPVLVALIVGGCAPAPRPRQRLEPFDVLIEPQVEVDSLHLAVGDPVEARAQLIVDRQTDSVPHGLIAICRAELLRDVLSHRRRTSRTSRETTSFRSRSRG